MSRYFSAEIRENRFLNKSYNLLALAPGQRSPEPLPGQFYMIEVSKGTDPLLKRPFSIFRRTPGQIEFLYRISGRGTSLLRDLKAGASVEMLGPLGTFYPVEGDGATPLLVAGGIGIASLFPLLEKFSGRAGVFYGARTVDELLMLDEIRKECRELHITTDDGTAGKRGTVIGALGDFIGMNLSGPERFVIYACGPRPVLREVTAIAAKHRIRAYLSLEEHMACGIGACLGCVVRTVTGYRRVCKEGPVFDSREILW